MAKPIKFKQVIFVLLPLLLILPGVVYYQDVLALFGLEKTAETIVPAKANLNINETESKIETPVEPAGNEPIDSAEGYSTATLPASTPEDINLDEDKAAKALQFLPAGLKELRDPFQNLIQQAELVAEQAEQSQLAATTDTVDAQNQIAPTAEDNPGEQGVTYEDLVTGVEPTEVFVQPLDSPKKPEIQYPPFELKGLVSQEGRHKAILVLQGQSYIVSGGERVQDWQIVEITPQTVYLLNQEGQRFRMTLGGVTIDEESDARQE